MEENGEVIPCPCGEFSSISSMREALKGPEDRVEMLLDWISGQQRAQRLHSGSERAAAETRTAAATCGGGGGKSSPCKNRAQASFAILNAIRDAVRPYLEAGKQQQQHQIKNSPRKDRNSFEEAFPALKNATLTTDEAAFPTLQSAVSIKNSDAMMGGKKGTAATTFVAPTEKASTTKPKRRIRPAIVTQTAWGQGNLVNLPPESSDPFPALSRQSATAVHTSTFFAAAQASSVVVTPKKTSQSSAPEAALRPVMVTPKKLHVLATKKKESRDEIAACCELQHLIDLYCVLIDSCLVPSSALELHLLIRLLTVSDEICIRNDDEEPVMSSFAPILSSADRCLFFAAAALRKLSGLLRGLGPVIFSDLVRCPPFCEHLPDLVEDFTHQFLQEQAVVSRNVSISVDQTALLTLPFKEERDSRHNYWTRDEQAVYKNREETRDAFLYQLRAFLNVKGTMVDAAQANRAIQKIRQSSRVIVNALMDSNLTWFAEFFCDILLQIGHVPIQETDTELLRIIDKDKLQKLHRRFSSKATSTDRSTKALVADPKREASSPVVAAQQNFMGHQEFFFLFIISADSYNFAMHLRALLVAKLRGIAGFAKTQETDKLFMDSRLLARFLGVLVFSPNWQSSACSGKPLVSSESSLDGLHQLSALVEDSMRHNSLVLAVTWVAELLKMSRWDVRVTHSRYYGELLSALRQIQIDCSVRDGEAVGSLSGNVLIRQCLEVLFGETVGLTQVMKLQVAPIDFSPFTDKTTTGSRSKDVGAMIVSTGALLASNPHIEELVALIADLSQKDSFSLRSPGASRKLRPSIVSPAICSMRSPITASPNIVYNDDLLADATAVSSLGENRSKQSDSLQSKLRDSFFHQHGELKNLCEFAAGQALKNIELVLVHHCIQPLIPLDLSNEDQLPALQRKVTGSCLTFLTTSLEEQISGTFTVLAPPESEPVVLKIAVTLAAAHGTQAGESMVARVVAAEMKKLKLSMARNDRKRLFTKDIDEPPSGPNPVSDAERRDHLVVVTTMIANLAQDLEALTERSEAVLSSLKSLNLELDDWSRRVDTTIPPESILRSFFESILLMDNHTETLTRWALSESSAPADTRWEVLAEFILSAVMLASSSRHGLRNLNTRLCDDDFLCRLIQLGDQARKTASLSILLAQLVETKTVRSSQIDKAVSESRPLGEAAIVTSAGASSALA